MGLFVQANDTDIYEDKRTPLKYYMMIIRFGFILMLLVSYDYGKSQSGFQYLRESNKNSKIALTDILGDWFSIDSQNAKISFIKIGNLEVYIDGKKDGVGNFSFIIAHDSMYVNGSAANWPPYYCTLSLLSRQTLEIKYYNFHVQGTNNIIYQRR